MYQMSLKSHFDSAHLIKDYVGKCSQLHGHRWDYEVTLEGPSLAATNILIDFSVVKAIMRNLVEATLDHKMLNDVLCEPNVTAEFLAVYIYKSLTMSLDDCRAKITKVTVWESPECSASFIPEVPHEG